MVINLAPTNSFEQLRLGISLQFWLSVAEYVNIGMNVPWSDILDGTHTNEIQ